jgi:hypothetical protein
LPSSSKIQKRGRIRPDWNCHIADETAVDEGP